MARAGRSVFFRDQRVILALLVFLYAWLGSAWLSDDAYLTLRTVDNAVQGLGLVWNPGERVAAYTHPLWMALMLAVYAVAQDDLWAGLLPGLLCTLGALGLLVGRLARRPSTAALGVGALALSRCFVDYSSSGLENPLSHLLVAAFVIALGPAVEGGRRLGGLGLIAGLMLLCRLDLALLVGPGLLWAARSRGRQVGLARAFGELAPGFAPLAAWTAFSLFYYGAPVPNTAYAKLGTGLALPALVAQGGWYFVALLQRDPLTALLIPLGLALGLRARLPAARPLALGVALVLLYLLRIGGDFMAGRFFTVPLFAAVALGVQAPLPAGRRGAAAVVALLGLGLLSRPSTLVPTRWVAEELPASVEVKDGDTGRAAAMQQMFHGIVDERIWYYRSQGLLSAERVDLCPKPLATGQIPRVVARVTVGAWGYENGRTEHIVDLMALGDPLLARLPAVRTERWRIGHFVRVVPPGYLDSLRTGEDQFLDPDLGRFYAEIHQIVSGDLLDEARLRAIWALNTGQRSGLVHEALYTDPPLTQLYINDLASAERTFPIYLTGAVISLGGLSHAVAVDMILSQSESFTVNFLREGRVLGSAEVSGAQDSVDEVRTRRVEVPKEASTAGFDSLGLLPDRRGDQQYRVGAVRLHEPGESLAPLAEEPPVEEGGRPAGAAAGEAGAHEPVAPGGSGPCRDERSEVWSGLG